MSKGNNKCIFILFAAMILFWLGCGSNNDNSNSHAGMPGMNRMVDTGAIPVKVDTVKIEPISAYILTNTTLEAQRQVDIIARVSGIVKNFYFEEGKRVKNGNVIVQLDDRELRLSMEQAKAKMENTKRLHDRSKEMYEKNLVSKETFDDARFQYETALSQYKNAVLQWEYSSIRAPLDGIITNRMVEIGDYVTVNKVVYTMADYDTLLARIYVPEKEIGKIKQGQNAQIEVEAFPDQKFTGRVKMINPVIDPTSGTVKVTVEIKQKNTGLLPGMFSSVYILTETHENAKIVPKKALILESETDRVFVYKDGKAHLRDVEVGFTDGNRLEILNGVQPDEVVVTVGQEGLRDGANVRIIGGPETTLAANAAATTDTDPPETVSSSEKHRGGFQPSPEQMKRIQERMLQNPDIRKEYEKRVEADPDFEKSVEKKMAFFREMREKYMQGNGRN